jgi:ribonuclease R
MRVDLDERKIDFEMSEKTVSAPVGRKRRGQEAAPAPAEKEKPAKAGRRGSGKEVAAEAYRPGDAAAKNAEVRKSREMKKALLAQAKGDFKGASGKSDAAASKPGKHRKGTSRSDAAPAAKSGSARKPKGKS